MIAQNLCLFIFFCIFHNHTICSTIPYDTITKKIDTLKGIYLKEVVLNKKIVSQTYYWDSIIIRKITYFPNGKKLADVEYQTDGNINGRFVQYNQDGSIKTIAHVTGFSIVNGRLIPEINEDYDLKILNGLWVNFHPNGTPSNVSYFQDGLKEGLEFTYKKNGKIKSITTYQKGKKCGSQTLFLKKGTKEIWNLCH